MLIMSFLLFAAGLGILVHQLTGLFSRKANDYEDRYLVTAEQELNELMAFISAEQLFRISLLASGLGAVVGLLPLLYFGVAAGGITSVLLGLLGFYLPRWTIQVLVIRRRNRFLQQFPDALGIISNSLKAGLSLMNALEQVALEMPEPVSQEFRLILKDRQLGRTIEEAMERLGKRMPMADVRIFIMVSKMSVRLGGNITEAYERVAETIRNRFMVEKKVKALTAEARMQGIVVSIIPFVMMGVISMMAPDLMRPLFTTAVGFLVLIVVVVLEIAGGYMMWKMSKVKY